MLNYWLPVGACVKIHTLVDLGSQWVQEAFQCKSMEVVALGSERAHPIMAHPNSWNHIQLAAAFALT